MTLSRMTFSIIIHSITKKGTQHIDARGIVLFMLSVVFFIPTILTVAMLSVVWLSVVAPLNWTCKFAARKVRRSNKLFTTVNKKCTTRNNLIKLF
jgi:hypothetical protein